jgi:hypothetical protein
VRRPLRMSLGWRTLSIDTDALCMKPLACLAGTMIRATSAPIFVRGPSAQLSRLVAASQTYSGPARQLPRSKAAPRATTLSRSATVL